MTARPDAPPPDRVLTVADYHDGPREGVAMFRGRPHSYRCVFDQDADAYSDRFELTPITDDAAAVQVDELPTVIAVGRFTPPGWLERGEERTVQWLPVEP